MPIRCHGPDGQRGDAYCVTLRLERKTDAGWRGIGKGSDRRSRDCFGATAETTAVWDAFVYPRDRLKRRFRQGKLRLHGFTTLGAQISYRR